MKRASDMDPEITQYATAMKQVNLVDRNPNPNGTQILALRNISKHDASDIIALATQIKHADSSLQNKACAKLTVILEQIKFLQAQAQKILDETTNDTNLHHAACNFKKIPGKIYHLYKRESSQQTYFSMLSPEEWGASLKDEFLGSYRLEYDQSWTPKEKIAEQIKTQQWVDDILNTKGKKVSMSAIEDITSMET